MKNEKEGQLTAGDLAPPTKTGHFTLAFRMVLEQDLRPNPQSTRVLFGTGFDPIPDRSFFRVIATIRDSPAVTCSYGCPVMFSMTAFSLSGAAMCAHRVAFTFGEDTDAELFAHKN
jgi:hypothetical protein